MESDDKEPGNAPPIDFNVASIKKLLARGTKRGFVTFNEISEALPEDKMSSDQIDGIMSAINDMGVQVVEEEDEFTDPEEFERRRASLTVCMNELRDAASSRWGILTREEIAASQRRHGLNEAQIDTVQAWLARPPKVHLVAEEDCVEGMPRPGVIPRRTYGERLGDGAGDNPRQLAISLDEIAQFGRQFKDAAQKLGITNPNVLITLGDLAMSGETFDDLFWVAGMQSTVSELAMKRLAGFVTDASLELACGLAKLGEETTELLRSWRAGQDYVLRSLDSGGYVRELRIGQQAWLRHSGKMPIGTDFPWTVTQKEGWRSLAASEFQGWREWAECMAWYVSEVRALYESDWKMDGSCERKDALESNLVASLVRWFDASPPPEFQTMEERLKNFAGTVHRRDPQTVSSAEPFWTTISVFPDTMKRIESLGVDGFADCSCLPFSLRAIGHLSLYRHDGSFCVPTGVLSIDEVIVDESYLTLPKSVREIKRLELRLYDDCFSAPGVSAYDLIELELSDFAIEEGVLEIGTLKADGSNVTLPSSLRKIGSVEVQDNYRDGLAEGVPPRSLVCREGILEIGSLTLGEDLSAALPRSLKKIGMVRLGTNAHMKIFASTIIEGEVELGKDAIIERVEARMI